MIWIGGDVQYMRYIHMAGGLHSAKKGSTPCWRIFDTSVIDPCGFEEANLAAESTFGTVEQTFPRPRENSRRCQNHQRAWPPARLEPPSPTPRALLRAREDPDASSSNGWDAPKLSERGSVETGACLIQGQDV
jgi:hypothetical protein